MCYISQERKTENKYYSKVEGYKIDTQKSTNFFNNEMQERECGKMIQFRIAPKNKLCREEMSV